jgi:hypothetical protein
VGSGESPARTTTTLPAWYVEIKSDAPNFLRIRAQLSVYSCWTVRAFVVVGTPRERTVSVDILIGPPMSPTENGPAGNPVMASPRAPRADSAPRHKGVHRPRDGRPWPWRRVHAPDVTGDREFWLRELPDRHITARRTVSVVGSRAPERGALCNPAPRNGLNGGERSGHGHAIAQPGSCKRRPVDEQLWHGYLRRAGAARGGGGAGKGSSAGSKPQAPARLPVCRRSHRL